jgi:MarR family 2-MHQ and catechol resistance regulon transcriptional repressor
VTKGIPAAPEDDARITAFGLFVEAFTGLSAKLAEQFAAHRLAPVEFEVLLRLARSPRGALRMTDLAAQTSMSTSGMTRVIDRLERESFVRRTACESDRRGWFAQITENGRARLADVLPGHLDLIDKWFTGQLSKHELDALLASLRKIRDAVRPDATAGASGEPGTG